VVANREGRSGEQVAVRPPGGELQVNLTRGRATLRGPTEHELGGEAETVSARHLDA